MSEESLRRIHETFEARIAGLDRVENGMEVLTEFVRALARDHAEAVFLTAQTTPGLTQEGAQQLADESLLRHDLAITETLHAFGGTLEMVLDLTEAAGTAYGARLAELSAGSGRGGVA